MSIVALAVAGVVAIGAWKVGGKAGDWAGGHLRRLIRGK